MMLLPKQLFADRRCCGRKAMIYKRPPHYFCPRCDVSYSLDDGKQIPNWAFEKNGNGFMPKGLSSLRVAELIDEGRFTILAD